MQKQHTWLVEQGVAVVETETRTDNLAMSKLNQSFGFVDVGHKQTGSDPVTIFRKQLAQPG